MMVGSVVETEVDDNQETESKLLKTGWTEREKQDHGTALYIPAACTKLEDLTTNAIPLRL